MKGTSSSEEVHEPGCGDQRTRRSKEHVPELTGEERKDVRNLLDAFDKSRWLTGLMIKVAIGVAALIGFFATVKGQLISLIRG